MNRTLTSEAFLDSIGLPLFDRDKFIQEKSRQLELEAKNAAQEAERKFKEEYYKSDDIRYASFDRPSKNAANAGQQGAMIYSSKLNEEIERLHADFEKDFSAREAQSRISRDELDEATTPADVRAAKAVVLLNENALRDGALQYTKEQEQDLKWIAEQDNGNAFDALQKQARLDAVIRDNLIARKDDILDQRRAAHIAAEDDRINNGALSVSAALDGYKSYSSDEIQRLQDAVDNSNSIWGRLSGKHGEAQEALKDFKAESEAELKRLEEEAKPRPFDEQKANKDLDALISKHSDAANASQKALEDARQKAREEGAEKARTLRKQAEQKQQQAPNQPKPVEAPQQVPDQKPEAPRAEPEKPVEQPTQVPEQKEPEQPLRDQVQPDQKAPTVEPVKPEPQKAPERPQPSPEKPVQKPDAPVQAPDQKPEVPRAEPEKPVEQPTQVPEQKEPEQPLRDQVPPAQEPPVQKPEPQQPPEKPTQKPDAPIRQGDQPLPPREPAQNKPPEQPSSRPDNKAIPEQKGNPVNTGKPGQNNADGKQGELPKLKDGPPKVGNFVRDENGQYKKPNADKPSFKDTGNGVTVKRPSSNEELIGAARLAQEKGMKNVRLNGSDEFKQRGWIELNARGIKTKGYDPTPEDVRAMKNRAAQLQNANTYGKINQGASQALDARQGHGMGQGGRKPREEDQPPPPPPKPIQQTQGAIR